VKISTWIRNYWRTAELRLTRAEFIRAGFPKGATGIMSTLDELIEQEMQKD